MTPLGSQAPPPSSSTCRVASALAALMLLVTTFVVLFSSDSAPGTSVTRARAPCPFDNSGDGTPCPFAAGDASAATLKLMAQDTKLSAAPDPEQGTVKGCKCSSRCAATIDDGFKCDWCYTAGSCGLWSLKGRYDYCVYPEKKTFETQSFEEKNKYFWDKIVADKQRASKYAPLTVILTESSQTSFWDMQDELPAGRSKGIHTIGAICQFKLDIAPGSPYTGLFASGPQLGFIRLGGAIAWSKDKGFAPGVGFKFARSGVPSGNFVTLNALDAATYNFFGPDMSNHIPNAASFATALLAKKFQQASQCPTQVGLSDMATYTQAGETVASPKTPFKLFLVASDAVQQPNTYKDIDGLMSEFEAIKVGTPIYTVYACGKGNGDAENAPTSGGIDKACGDPFKLGDVVTTSECTTSNYGDNKFFIRHQPIEQDWAANPQFLKQYDPSVSCGWSNPTADGAPKSCAAK